MKAGIIYRGVFENTELQMVFVSLFDNETLIDDAADPMIIDITLAESPVVDSVIDNNEDKFTPIRAKQVKIAFHSQSDIGIETFADGSDNRWYVEVAINDLDKLIFRGYASLSDISEDFQPDPNVIEIVATDGLGSLKDQDFEGLTGMNRIAEYLSEALRRTGLELLLYVVNNLRRGSGSLTADAQFIASGDPTEILLGNTNWFYPGQTFTTSSALNPGPFTVTDVGVGILTLVQVDGSVVDEGPLSVTFNDTGSEGHFYDNTYLDARTFEGLTWYEVIERILGMDCFITQWKGRWYIMRVDEFDLNPIIQATFDVDGGFIEYLTPVSVVKQIGVGQSLSWMNDDTLVTNERQVGKLALRYNYDTPQELPCNNDFSRGDILTTSPSANTYTLDCWELRRQYGLPITSTAFIRRVYDPEFPGYEKERYMVITPSTGDTTPWDFVQSEAIPVNEKDKMSVSVDFRWSSNAGSGGGVTYYPMTIFLIDELGQYWYWSHPSSTDIADFYWMGPEPSEGNKYIPVSWVLSDVDETEWRTLSVELAKMPAAGKLYIGLLQMNQSGTSADDVEAQYSNLRVDYLPFINGSYQTYTAQESIIEQAGTRNKREDEVYISDSPSKLFKGALQYPALSGEFVLANRFFAGNVYPANNPPADAIHPYGYIQAYSVWNQCNRGMRKFEGTIDGLNTDTTELPDIVHMYELTDTNPNSTNKFFMLLHREQDLHLCEWSGLLHEVYDTVILKRYSDPFTFKFISENE